MHAHIHLCMMYVCVYAAQALSRLRRDLNGRKGKLRTGTPVAKVLKMVAPILPRKTNLKSNYARRWLRSYFLSVADYQPNCRTMTQALRARSSIMGGTLQATKVSPKNLHASYLMSCIDLGYEAISLKGGFWAKLVMETVELLNGMH